MYEISLPELEITTNIISNTPWIIEEGKDVHIKVEIRSNENNDINDIAYSNKIESYVDEKLSDLRNCIVKINGTIASVNIKYNENEKKIEISGIDNITKDNVVTVEYDATINDKITQTDDNKVKITANSSIKYYSMDFGSLSYEEQQKYSNLYDIKESEDYIEGDINKKSGGVIVKYITEEGIDIIEPEVITGNIGDSYETTAKEWDDYIIVKLPENESGKMQEDVTTVEYVYKKIQGSIKITKVDAKDINKKLEGATFSIEKIDTEGEIDNNFVEIQKTTSEDGIVIFENLEVGKYRITEVKAPEGYSLLRNSIELEINKDNINHERTVGNNGKLILPETGGKGMLIIIFGGIIVIYIGTMILKNNRKVLDF